MNTLIKFSDARCHPVSAQRPTWPRGGFVNTTREQLTEIGRAFAKGDKRTVDQTCEELKATSLRRLRKTVSRNSQAVTPAPEAMRPNRLVGVHGNRRQRSLALLCWLVFAAGLLVQFFSPHLKVSNGAFVIPQEMAAGRNAIRPDEIVGGQRQMQLLSVLLTVSGALGLAFLYRDILIGAASRRSSELVEEPACRNPREVSSLARHEKP
jgi:hypothetical protein